MAAKIKKGDRVVVLTGKDKGRTGAVLKVLPSENRVVVEGVNMVQRHTRPSQADPQGGIKNKEASLHLSNVVIADANGKAIALGEAEGFTKTVFDAKTGELLGAHMIGAEVTEMIQGYTIGKTLETTEAELMQTVFPHPTISESMHESVLAAYGRALHI